MNPILSIIVTTHNFEDFITPCLISIKECIKTEYRNDIEVILIDDKSNDKNSSIMIAYKNSEKKFRYFRTEFGNIGKVRNFAIKNSRGQYITFIDGDDTLPTFNIYKVIDFMMLNKADILISKINDVNQDSDYIKKSTFSTPLKLTKHKSIQDFLIHKKFQAHLCSKFFNKDLFNNLSIPEISCYEDALVFPDILIKSNNIFITNSVFYNYIKRSDSLSNKITHYKADIMADVILYMNDKFDDKYHNLITTHAVEHLLKNKNILSNDKILKLEKNNKRH
ncbi:glycosyltransferase family 2 protein [Xenorhabdus nematophila]|uniref:glycosyltransferase family 2 protein n=1 Tax=Xenorhabdus nematophila TaxID=628 RepID=UPI0032B767D3